MLSENGLQRHVKRYFPKQDISIYVPCPLGLEQTLFEEIFSITGKTGVIDKGGVEIHGDWSDVYRINYFSRIATKVLVRLFSFYASSYPEMFDKMQRYAWQVFLGFSFLPDFRFSVSSCRLHHTDHIAKTLNDAMQKQMQKALLSWENRNEKIKFNVRGVNDQWVISVDTSGDALYKRGYRNYLGKAPLRANLAAGMISFFNHDTRVIVDAFAGSGTLVSEYIGVMNQLPVGEFRSFSFLSFPYFIKDRWQSIIREGEHRKKNIIQQVFLNDIDVLHQQALQNFEKILDLNLVEYHSEDAFAFFEKPFGGEFSVISNLPYGKRIVNEKSFSIEMLLKKVNQWGKLQNAGFLSTSGNDIFNKYQYQKIPFRNGGLSVNFFIR